MSQSQWILKALEQRPLTAIEALEGCGCFRLAARIKELREQGHDIKTKPLILPDGKIVAQYHLEVTKLIGARAEPSQAFKNYIDDKWSGIV